MAIGKKKEKGVALVYGIHPLIELFKAKKRKLAILYTTKPEPKAWKMVASHLPKGLQIQYVKREVLTKLAGTTDHQGFVGYATAFAYRKKFFTTEKHPFLVLLDGIQDARNLGAILRSAYCTNVSGVIITQRGSAPLNEVALKASAGLAEHLDIYVAPSAKAAMLLLKQEKYQVYLAMPEKAQNALEVPLAKPLCLVIGSEGTGVSPDIKKDGVPIMLPQKTPDISYNASVAAGILLFLTATKNKLI